MKKEIPIFNLNGEKIATESVNVPAEKPNMDVIHRYVVAFLANQRQGTASTKTRGEVSGSGRKPWRQKGTGRARVGSIRTPIWRHGGIVFGPKPREYSQCLPEKMKKLALRDTLRTTMIDDGLILIDVKEGINNPKTKIFSEFLKKAGLSQVKVLVVVDNKFEQKDAVIRCIRNIENVSYCYAEQINPYLILTHDKIVAQRAVFPLLRKFCAGEENV
ncbi:MAG TPA: 50S ribosomal protein L4 [bacterium]|nr:50S ribosomal protein L4 [bacterium]HOL35947.1 50S ribosomal protein L4 [bacterium]